jgi:SAM-dependent methyltransferase
MSADDLSIAALTEANRSAWNVVAANYARGLGRDIADLRAGRSSFLAPELEVLLPLMPGCRRAIHVACSHGQEALSLWVLGAREVVGIDLSEEMLALARHKAEALGAPVSWRVADMLALPADLRESADLVYTGRGAIPWALDLDTWAAGIAGLMVPGGHFFAFEGHPLNTLWDREAPDVRLLERADYFAGEPRANTDFPASFLERSPTSDGATLQAFQRSWTLGEIVTALANAGLRLERLSEYSDQFWDQFTLPSSEALRRVPHTFSLLMSRP